MSGLVPAIVAVLLVTILTGLLPFRRACRTEDRNPLNPARLFLLYLLLQVAVSGLITLLIAQLTSYTPDPATNEGVYLKSALLTFAAVVAFNFGYWSTPRRDGNLPDRVVAAWSESRQIRCALFLYASGYLAAAGLVASAGGLAAMLANREEFRGGGIAGKGYLVYPMTMGLALGGLMALDVIVRRPATLRRNLLSIAVVVAAMLPAVLTGFRGLILMPIAITGIYFHYNVRSIANRRGFLLLGGLIVLFTAYGVYRALPERVDPVEAVETVAQTDPALFFGPLTRSAGLEATAQIVKTMQDDPRIENEWFLPGAYETLTTSIPQAVWPDKPDSTGNRSGEIFFLNALRGERGADWENPGGVSPTMIGWGYWQGGVVGLAFFSFVMGWLFQRFVMIQREWGDSPAVRIGFAFLTPGLFLSAEFPQGYANTGFQSLIVLAGLVVWMTRSRSSERRASAPVASA